MRSFLEAEIAQSEEEIEDHFYTMRMINCWNKVAREVVHSLFFFVFE